MRFDGRLSEGEKFVFVSVRVGDIVLRDEVDGRLGLRVKGLNGNGAEREGRKLSIGVQI